MASAKVASAQLRTRGFGVPDTIDPHHFVVRVPSGNAGDILIVENFGLTGEAGDEEEFVRCRLSRSAWNGIRNDAKRVLNDRLREKKLSPSRWSAGDNVVERLLGRELCVLAWAVEKSQATLYPAACVVWAGLKPEERWWLFRMCDLATGDELSTDIGWRKAVRIALTETPGPEIAVTTRRRRRVPEDDAIPSLFAELNR